MSDTPMTTPGVEMPGASRDNEACRMTRPTLQGELSNGTIVASNGLV
jgi:hypothetical protein